MDGGGNDRARHEHNPDRGGGHGRGVLFQEQKGHQMLVFCKKHRHNYSQTLGCAYCRDEAKSSYSIRSDGDDTSSSLLSTILDTSISSSFDSSSSDYSGSSDSGGGFDGFSGGDSGGAGSSGDW
jgi:uncharacterized membrane protein YgcG